MTSPTRVIYYRVVVKPESNRSIPLETVVEWAQETLCEAFTSEGYEVQIDPPRITNLRGKTLRY